MIGERSAVEYVGLGIIEPNDWNANTLTEDLEKQLVEQMRISGSQKTPPLIVREFGEKFQIIDGEQRWRIAKRLGWKSIGVINLGPLSDREAMRLSLSYNAIRGTLSWTRLLETALKRPEIVEVYKEVLVPKDWESLKNAMDKLTEDTKRVIENGIKKGARISPQALELIASVPQELQADLAEDTIKTPDVEVVKSLIEERVEPYASKLEEGGEEEEEAEVEEETEEDKWWPPKAETLVANETAAYLKLEPGEKLYAVYYDKEKNKVAAKHVKGDFDAIENKYIIAKVYEFSCPKCGTKLTVDVDSGEVAWS